MSAGKITIKVLHGKIYNIDKVGSCELYVKIKMGNHEDQSSVETKGKNETVFDFTTAFKRDHEDKICFEFWQRKGTDDSLLGKGAINIPEVTKTGKWTDFVEMKNHGKVSGEFYVDVNFLPDRLEQPSSPGKQSKHHHTQTIQNY